VPATVRVRLAGRVRNIRLDDYVLGAVLAEISPVGETAAVTDEVFEIQAIIARTYAVSQIGRHAAEGFDLCDTTHCQLFDPSRVASSRFAAPARAAIEQTRGTILTYGGHVAETLFHADCGGATAAADDVWGGRSVPYLQSIPDQLSPETHRAWNIEASAAALRTALNADARTVVGGHLDAIEVLARDESGRAAGLGVRGERSYTVRGDVLRSVLNLGMGGRGLQSTRFTITRNADRYLFEGTGFGHGVGLCQRGAIARARRGDGVAAILATYFAGARLSSFSGANPTGWLEILDRDGLERKH
jgi:stage II sporulation protein D